MGLDMYLTGKKYLWTDWANPEKNIKEDGFRVKERRLELGYWRKHPNLHGYIVEKYGGGEDTCQEIDLDLDALRDILAATKEKRLPETSGFFFGKSQPEDEPETIAILEKAIKWLEEKESGVIRSISYQASW